MKRRKSIEKELLIWNRVNPLLIILSLYIILLSSGCTQREPPVIEGPYITRIVSEDNLWVLQHIEKLPLDQLTSLKMSIYDSFPMTNSTLEMFLNRINLGKARSYYFNWTVSLIPSDSPVLNSSVFSSSWRKVSNADPTIVVWWDNGTRFIYDESRDLTIFLGKGTQIAENTSRLIEARLEIKWIFLGMFQYDESSGPLAGHFIKGYQLLFLNEELDLVCFAYFQAHAVA